jgi:hypothetical protein
VKAIGSFVALALSLSLQACVPQAMEQGVATEPVRWILVERRYGDLEAPPSGGDGTINPDAVVLGLQPLYPEDLTWEVVVSPEEHFVELVGLSPSGPVGPGEVVSAAVRVAKAHPDRLYRLRATPSQPDIRLYGQREAIVNGGATAVFRFTSSASGRAGIAVGVEVISRADRTP